MSDSTSAENKTKKANERRASQNQEASSSDEIRLGVADGDVERTGTYGTSVTDPKGPVSIEEAEARVADMPVAHAFKEADEKGYFGETPEEVPTEAFTFGGVASDPERAAVSGRPHVAKKLGRHEDGSQKD